MPRVREWSIDNADFMRNSGRNKSKSFDDERVRQNEEYRNALQNIKAERKSSDGESFQRFITVRLENLRAMRDELVSARRRNHDWKSSRKLCSYLSRVCDRLFDRESLNFRQQRKRKATTGFDPDSPLHGLSVKNLKRRLTELRRARTEKGTRKTVVFFGDGTFQPGGFGYAPVPKKKLLKNLCTKGLTVLLDEHNTSKFCPYERKLRTKPNFGQSTRATVHETDKTDPTTCAVLMLYLQMAECDRDISGINMLMCGWGSTDAERALVPIAFKAVGETSLPLTGLK